MPDRRARIAAGTIEFRIRHNQWDANIHHHADQGVTINVTHPDAGAMLAFNCYDVERSYIYGPDTKKRICRMDPIVDGNPISWSVKQLRNHLPAMLSEAGYGEIAETVDMAAVSAVLPELEETARRIAIHGRLTVKHNRGTDMFEAGIIRFGLELRDLGNDGGLAIHVLSDLDGTPSDSYAEETEILAFDCFRKAPHYHYGPRNKNHRIYWDKVVVPDPLEWTLTQLKAGKLKSMIEAAGYPGVALDLDESLVASLLPALEARAREMQPKAA